MLVESCTVSTLLTHARCRSILQGGARASSRDWKMLENTTVGVNQFGALHIGAFLMQSCLCTPLWESKRLACNLTAA